MSAESSDCEQISEWTIVSASGDDEVPSVDVSATGSTPEGSRERTLGGETSGGARLEHFQLESKLCEMLEVLKDKEDGVLPKNPSKEGSEASDIERISDDGLDSLNYSMEGSVISHISAYSLLNAPESMDADTESLSGSSGISVIQEDDVRSTNYMHTPNRKLNFTLNLLLVLSVTMVVGLGVGHFIGWSSRWMHARQIHQANIAKLKALQEELVDCLQNPSSYYLETNGESKACYEKVDYWKKKFEDMLSENRVLQEFVDRTMHKAELGNDDEDEKCEEANKNIVTEYRQLKFHLIMQQLENVATLRQVEALKHQEMETLYRVKQLEEENEELKAQVEEDSNADALKEAEEKAIIMELAAENMELKQELNKLMDALKLEKEEDEKKTSEELWPLRQQINQLQVENSELKHVIGKLRYGQHPAKQPAKKQEKNVPPRSRFGNREPPQKPDNALHSWLVDNMKELNLTDFIEYLTKVAMDKEAARQELMHLEENLKLSYKQLSEKAKHGIDTGKTLLSDLQKSLHSKLEQIMNVDPSDIALPIEHIQKAGKTLKKTVEKMYEIGMDMLNTKEEDGPESDGNHKFKKQVDKLMVKFGKQWENIKSSVWGAKTEEESMDIQYLEEKENHEKLNDDIFVAASREDHEKDKEFSHEERTEKSKKEKKEEKNKQKKTAISNGKEQLTEKEQLHPTEESNTTEKQSKKEEKNIDKEAEKYKENYNKSSEEKSSKKKNLKNKSKWDINDKEEKFRKHRNEDAHEGKQKKTSKNGKKLKKRGNSETSIENRGSSENEKKKDKSNEYKLKRKRDNNHENDEENSSKSKMNKNKQCKGKRKDDVKEFEQKEKHENHHENKGNIEENSSKSKINDKKNHKDKLKAKSKGFKRKENSDKSHKNDAESTSRSKVNKNKNRKQNTNHTEFNDEQSGDWMFQRAKDRTTKRKSKHQSDWLFERAYDREYLRRESQKSEWYFKKNNEDGKSKKSNDDKEATKSNKKTNKMRKNQKHWEDEDPSNEEEFTWSERRSRRHAHHYEYNVDWAMPDSRAYYSSCS